MYSDALRFVRLAFSICLLSWLALGSALGQGRVSVIPAPADQARNNSSARQESADSDSSRPRSANYQLLAGDSVSVKVFREPSLDTSQRIGKDGTINYPLLGVIRLAGKTTNEAAGLIAALLEKDYIVHPQVAVTISNYVKQKFTVLGQVQSPGSYEIPDEQTMDLLAAIAKAGGFTRLAEPKHVTVRRLANGEEKVFEIDAKKLMNDKTSTRFQVQPNDTISVAERFF